MTNGNKSLPKSQRILNYAKASATSTAAIGALVAMLLGAWNVFKGEPLAEESHKQVRVQVERISNDMQQAYQERKRIDEACEQRVTALREDMKAFVDGLQVGLGARAARSGGPPRHGDSASGDDSVLKIVPLERAPAPKAAPRLQAPQQYQLPPVQQMVK